MQSSQLQAGDLVDVKGHGRATVLEPPGCDPSHPRFGRCLVRYHEDDTTFWANPKKLRKLKLSTSRVVVCFRTEHYRAAAVNNVERSDVCLEVGSHNGTTTRILHNRCKYVVGIDNVQLMVDQARARSPHVRFELADGYNIDQLRSLSPTGNYDKIFIDVSGKAPLFLITRMLTLYLGAFSHSKIIVKNEALFSQLEKIERQQGQQQAAEQRCVGEQGTGEQQQQQQLQQEEQPPVQQQDGQPGSPLQAPNGRCHAQPGPCSHRSAVQRSGGSQDLPGSNGVGEQQQQQQEPEVAQAGGAGNPAGNSAAAGELALSLVQLCELFRERYVSHPIAAKVHTREKWRGRRPGAPEVAGSASSGEQC